MSAFYIVKETLEDGLVQWCVFDAKKNEVVARYANKKEADEVLVRYQSVIDRMDTL